MEGKDNLTGILEDAAEYALRQEDFQEGNHTFGQELELLEEIKRGDVSRVMENLKNGAFPEYPELLGGSAFKTEEYVSVISVALASRTAIDAGMTSRECFQISDLYLRRLAAAKNQEELVRIREEALVTYARLVADNRGTERTGRYIDECKEYIAAHIFKKISVRGLAVELGLSPIYLERLFKQSEGVTIGAYIQREKIERAKNLLRYSDRSLFEISEYLGFSSQSYFGRIFKKATGMTPKQYRKEQPGYRVSKY